MKDTLKIGDRYHYLTLIQNYIKSFRRKDEKTLPTKISSNQTAYVNKRCTVESGRLISDIIEVCETQNIGGGYLVTMDIEKAFDSLETSFSI